MAADGDLGFFLSTGIPTNDSSTSGGAITATALPSSVNNLLPSMAYPVSSSTVWYYSFFLKLAATASGTLASAVIWLPNALTTFSVAGVLTAYSTNASDGALLSLVPQGFNNSGGAYATETIAMNGVSTVTGAITWKTPLLPKIGCVYTSGGAPATPAGTIYLYVGGSLVGMIPGTMGDLGYTTGYSFASGEYQMAIESSLGTSVTATNRLTAPSSAPTFSLPNTQANGLVIPTMSPGNYQQIWLKMTGLANMQKSTQSQIVPWVIGVG